jgi:hypothetical protein
MVTTDRAIRMAIHTIIDQYQLDDWGAVMKLVLGLCYTLIGPILLSVLSIVTTYQLLKKIEQWIAPPPPQRRYEDAIGLYQSGKVREALRVFTTLQQKDKYGNAILSLAAHEIYVSNNPIEGLRILQDATKPPPPPIIPSSQPKEGRGKHTRIMRNISRRSMQSMQDDAKAIMAGNSNMVDMNARLAKQQYLGIGTI